MGKNRVGKCGLLQNLHRAPPRFAYFPETNLTFISSFGENQIIHGKTNSTLGPIDQFFLSILKSIKMWQPKGSHLTHSDQCVQHTQLTNSIFFEGPRIISSRTICFTLGKIIQSPYLVSGAECKAWIRVVLRRERERVTLARRRCLRGWTTGGIRPSPWSNSQHDRMVNGFVKVPLL